MLRSKNSSFGLVARVADRVDGRSFFPEMRETEQCSSEGRSVRANWASRRLGAQEQKLALHCWNLPGSRLVGSRLQELRSFKSSRWLPYHGSGLYPRDLLVGLLRSRPCVCEAIAFATSWRDTGSSSMLECRTARTRSVSFALK